MAYKLYLVGFASLLTAAVNAQSYTFYSGSGCSGNNIGYCDGARTNPTEGMTDYCYWNSWVGSIYYDNGDPDISTVFYGCSSGDTSNWQCDGSYYIALTGNESGCQDIGNSNGILDVYDNNDPGCYDCIGTAK